MAFPYHILTPDLRRVLDAHIRSHEEPAEQSSCSVETDGDDEYRPASLGTVIIEGFIARAPHEDKDFGPRFHDQVKRLSNAPHTRSDARQLLFRGPSLIRRVELALDCFRCGPGLLAPCCIHSALKDMPAVDTLVFDNIWWIDCPLHDSTSWDTLRRRSFKSVVYTDIEVVSVHTDPFLALRAASSIDELVLGFVHGTMPTPEDISHVSLHRVVFREVGTCGCGAFKMISTAASDTIVDLELHDVGTRNIEALVALINAHCRSITRLIISFHGYLISECHFVSYYNLLIISC